MTDDTLPVHGGNVARAAELYGGDASDYLDFSANINPLGPPERVVTYLRECAADPSRLARYPDVAYGALRRAVAAHEDIDATSVVVGNGSAALLGAAIRAVRPQSCLLPLPAFSEYAYALRAAGVRTIPFELSAAANFQIDVDDFISALKRHRPDLCIVNNPHNPSGNMLPAQSLRAIVRSAHAIDVTVLVDEAFIDYAPDESLTRDAATETNLIVIRSLTKFYAMPALRVGYAVVAPEHVRAIAAQLPSWPVSTIAADAATCALSDPDYERRTRAQNERQRLALSTALDALSFQCLPAHANFVLVRTLGDAADFADAMAHRERILLRECSSYDGLEKRRYLRIAVRDAAANRRLVEAAALARSFSA